jgi:hypothetical protein
MGTFANRLVLERASTSLLLSLAIAISASGAPAGVQTADPMFALAARSAIVVVGTVTQVGASEEPLLAPTSATMVIKIKRMVAGSEIAGDQTGRTATVVLSKNGDLKVGTEAFFFGNPCFIGKTITIADEGELPVPQGEVGGIPPALASGLQARRDAPVRMRLALATLVFRGTVESVSPLAPTEAGRLAPGLRKEHDPDWQLALVRVTLSLRGTRNGAVVPVVFPASRDIVWFNSPKLRPGEAGLFLAHPPQEDEARLLRAAGALRRAEEQHAIVVSQPFDFLSPSDEDRVIRLLQTKEAP